MPKKCCCVQIWGLDAFAKLWEQLREKNPGDQDDLGNVIPVQAGIPDEVWNEASDALKQWFALISVQHCLYAITTVMHGIMR